MRCRLVGGCKRCTHEPSWTKRDGLRDGSMRAPDYPNRCQHASCRRAFCFCPAGGEEASQGEEGQVLHDGRHLQALAVAQEDDGGAWLARRPPTVAVSGRPYGKLHSWSCEVSQFSCSFVVESAIRSGMSSNSNRFRVCSSTSSSLASVPNFDSRVALGSRLSALPSKAAIVAVHYG